MNEKLLDFYFLKHIPTQAELIKLNPKEKKELEYMLDSYVSQTELLLKKYEGKPAYCCESMLSYGLEKGFLNKRKELLNKLRKAKNNEKCTVLI